MSRELRPACTQPHIWLILCWFGSLSRIVSCLGATVVERTIILKYNNPCTGHFIQCSLYTSSLAPPSSSPGAVIDKAYYPVLLVKRQVVLVTFKVTCSCLVHDEAQGKIQSPGVSNCAGQLVGAWHTPGHSSLASSSQ